MSANKGIKQGRLLVNHGRVFWILSQFQAIKYSKKGLLMYVSDETLALASSNNTTTAEPKKVEDNESSSAFFNDMVASFMEEHTNKLKALSKSIELKNQEIISSFSHTYSQTQIINYSFEQNTSLLMSNIEGYFSSSSNFNSSFAILEQWLSEENATRKTLIDYLLEISDKDPEKAAGTVSDIFDAHNEIQDRLASIAGSSASKDSYISSALKAISMEVDTFGAENIFGSISMEVKMQKMEAYTVDSVEDCELVENGGDMIEYEGKYVKISIFLHFVDPVVLDLDGNGIDLRSVQDGVVYDIKGDGSEVQTGFVQGDDALLFFDSNGDGVCTSGKEMFGDQEGDANGFAEMSRYDENHDGVLNSEDAIYKDLKVWNDLNGDGKSQKDEIRTLEAAGVSELSLGYDDIFEENAGNMITQDGAFTRNDGTRGRMVDVQFRYTQHNIFDY